MTPIELINRHNELVWKIAHKLSKGNLSCQSDDLAQCGFLAIVENADKYDESRGAETTFVYHVSRNAMLKEIKRAENNFKKNLPIELAFGDGYTEEHFDFEDFIGPDADQQLRHVVTMKYRGLTNREAARNLGLSGARIAKIINRAKKRIKKHA